MYHSIMFYSLLWALALGLSSTAFAYVPSTTFNTHTRMRWMETNCIFMRINQAGSADIADGSDITAVEQSIETWQTATSSCSYMKFVVLDPSADAKPGFDANSDNENVIYWQEKTWPAAFDKEAAAITTVVYIDKEGHSQEGRILDADIELNGANFTFVTKGGVKFTDIQNTVTHELGHLLGLDHTCYDSTAEPPLSIPLDHNGVPIPACKPTAALSPALQATTMFPYTGPGDLEKRSLEADDIQGVCDTYPLNANPGVCAPHNYSSDTGCAMTPSRTLAPGSLITLMIMLLMLIRVRRSHFGTD